MAKTTPEPDTEINKKGFPDTREDFTERPEDAAGDDVPPMTKGRPPHNASYAKGGPVINEGRSIFMKQPDPFRTDFGRQDYNKKTPGGEMSNPPGKDGKIMPTIKPRT